MEALSGEPGKYGDTACVGRKGGRKANFHRELNLLKDVKGDKKGFYRYTSSKSKSRETMGPLLDGAGNRVIKDMEKMEVPQAFFALIFTRKTSLQESQVHETSGKVWNKAELLLMEEAC